MKPTRIQLKRTRGWRIPPNTVIVDRRSKWGNPYIVGRDGTAEECVRRFAEEMAPYTHHGKRNGMGDFLQSQAVIEGIEAELKGKNLACWCSIGAPCHADWLLKIANG